MFYIWGCVFLFFAVVKAVKVILNIKGLMRKKYPNFEIKKIGNKKIVRKMTKIH